MSKNTFQKSLPKTSFIILLPLRKNKRRGNFRNGNKIQQLGTNIIEAVAKPGRVACPYATAAG
jgi:hypothetical protein